MLLQYLLQLCRYVRVPVCNIISTSIDKQSLILAKYTLYNFVPRSLCIFEKTKAQLRNRLLASFHFLKEKHRYAISPCKRKTKINTSFNQTGVKFAAHFIKVSCCLKKNYIKVLSTIIFRRCWVCYMLLLFIMTKFCKIFCCLRLHIIHGY